MMPADGQTPDEELKAARAIAAEISQYRREFMDKTRQDFERELGEVAASGFDPALGRGRGPRWADGG